MSDYKVTMGFELPEGFTEEEFYYRLYGSTKHSELSWWIINFEELETEEDDCE